MMDDEKNLFIAIVTYKVSVEERMKVIESHKEFLQKYAQKGIFITAGPLEPYTGGVVIARAESKAAIEEIMKEDPFYQRDFYDLEIYEFKPRFFIG